MEKPLMGGESSGSGVRRRGHYKHSDAIAYGSRYQRAAALIDLAEDGIGLPEQILDQSNFQNAAKLYFIFTRFDIIWSLTYFALIVLNFLEKPLWCTNYSTYSCDDREYFYLGQLPYLTGAETLIYEGITLILLVIHTFFPISYEGYHLYWRNPLNWLKVTCLLILVADILVYALYLSPVAFDYLPLRIAPYIRVVLFMLNFRELRATIFILAGMLGTYLNVLRKK
ncbi:two pore calcium channel protein 1A-like [Corylus avellana]|uniref:two pore calcium channel protein 1A-like n=1 Tax=Corylus avellana TaxID=13451 RepID=UPI00286AB083|nr:two pore calcium channel protein 1A-like [Corylus avellana]